METQVIGDEVWNLTSLSSDFSTFSGTLTVIAVSEVVPQVFRVNSHCMCAGQALLDTAISFSDVLFSLPSLSGSRHKWLYGDVLNLRSTLKLSGVLQHVSCLIGLEWSLSIAQLLAFVCFQFPRWPYHVSAGLQAHPSWLLPAFWK